MATSGIIYSKMRVLIGFVVLTLLSDTAAGAPTLPDAAIEFFHANCVMADGYGRESVQAALLASGARAVPKEILDSDPVMRRLGGKGFFINRGGTTFIVVYANQGGCSLIISHGFDAAEFRSSLKKAYTLVSEGTESEGPQVEERYMIGGKSRYSGSLIEMVFPKGGDRADVGTIGFVPRGALRRPRVTR